MATKRKTQKTTTRKKEHAFSDVFITQDVIENVSLRHIPYSELKIACKRYSAGRVIVNRRIRDRIQKHGKEAFFSAAFAYFDEVDIKDTSLSYRNSSALFQHPVVVVKAKKQDTKVEADGKTITHRAGISDYGNVSKTDGQFKRESVARQMDACIVTKTNADTGRDEVRPKISKSSSATQHMDLSDIAAALVRSVRDQDAVRESVEKSTSSARAVAKLMAKAAPKALRCNVQQDQGYAVFPISGGTLPSRGDTTNDKKLITKCLQNNPGTKGLGEYREMHMDGIPLDKRTRALFESATDYKYVKAEVYILRSKEEALARDIYMQIKKRNKNPFVLQYITKRSLNYSKIGKSLVFDEDTMVVTGIKSSRLFGGRTVIKTSLVTSVIDFSIPEPSQGRTQFEMIRSERKAFVVDVRGMKRVYYQRYISHDALDCLDFNATRDYQSLNAERKAKMDKIWGRKETYFHSVRARKGLSVYVSGLEGGVTGEKMLPFLLAAQYHCLTYLLTGISRRNYPGMDMAYNAEYNIYDANVGRNDEDDVLIDIGVRTMQVMVLTDDEEKLPPRSKSRRQQSHGRRKGKERKRAPPQIYSDTSDSEPEEERRSRTKRKRNRRKQIIESSDSEEGTSSDAATSDSDGSEYFSADDGDTVKGESSWGESDYSSGSDEPAPIQLSFSTGHGSTKSKRKKGKMKSKRKW